MIREENVLDVLLYLFENYLDDNADATYADRDTLTVELEAAGFPSREVSKAFDWLESLTEGPRDNIHLTQTQSVRIFSPVEQARLDARCRGLIRHLSHIGILDSTQREMVIDRILALETPTVDLDDVKWVVLMVLFNQPGQETALARMENFVFEDCGAQLH